LRKRAGRAGRPSKNARRSSDDTSIRPFWSGTISFGLVSIPVDLFPARRTPRTSLRMLGADGIPLARRYFSPSSGKDLEDDQTIRGYEIKKDKYVPVTDEELERLAPDKSRDIDLRRFVNRDEIQPIYFEHAYFLAPAGGSVKAYQLLAETMERTGKAGIATFVMREKEYLVAILAEDGVLRAETLLFSDEVRSPKSIGLPRRTRVSQAATRRFARMIRNKSTNQISREELRDIRTERLSKLVERKRSRHEDVVKTESGDPQPAKVVDLMEVLKKSLAGKRAA
jgi:DNA end-binding protein Ku